MVKVIAFILLLAMAALVFAEELPSPNSGPKQYDESKMEELFETFVNDFNKTYKDEADKLEHYKIFADMVKKINQWNRVEYPETSHSINQFTDYNDSQRKAMFWKIPFTIINALNKIQNKQESAVLIS